MHRNVLRLGHRDHGSLRAGFTHATFLENGVLSRFTARRPFRPQLTEIPCRLNRWMQHWLGVYLREFQSLKFSAGVD